MAEVLDVAIRWRERRAEVRSLCDHLGKDYDATVEPLRATIRSRVARTGQTVVEVVIAMHQAAPRLSPAAGAVLLAAALDVLEEAPRG